MTSSSWIDLESEEGEESPHSHNSDQPFAESDGSLTTLPPSPPIPKRKERAEEDENEDIPELKKVRHEPTFHPLYDECAPRVTLLSNDGQKFCVEKRLLSTHSTFFKDMFSLPAPNTVSSVNMQIDLDEPAEVIERVLHRLNIATLNDVAFTTPSLGMSYNEVKFHDKFNINTGRKSAEEALRVRIKRDPFATLAYASRKNDVALGRQAIKLIRFGSKISGEVNLWAKMSDVKPSWQLAFAKLTLPEFSYRYDGSSIHERDDAWSSVGISLETRGHRFDMEAVAAQFNPKWVHQIAKPTSTDQQGLGVTTRNCLGMWDQ